MEITLFTLLFGQEYHISGVEPMEVGHVEGVKEMYDPHDVPTFIKKTPMMPSASGVLSLDILLMAY